MYWKVSFYVIMVGNTNKGNVVLHKIIITNNIHVLIYHMHRNLCLMVRYIDRNYKQLHKMSLLDYFIAPSISY